MGRLRVASSPLAFAFPGRATAYSILQGGARRDLRPPIDTMLTSMLSGALQINCKNTIYWFNSAHDDFLHFNLIITQ